jgi:hypothetical protein
MSKIQSFPEQPTSLKGPQEIDLTGYRNDRSFAITSIGSSIELRYAHQAPTDPRVGMLLHNRGYGLRVWLAISMLTYEQRSFMSFADAKVWIEAILRDHAEHRLASGETTA